MIAVHSGAGSYSEKYHSKYKKMLKRACRAGNEIIKNGGTALEGVKAAIKVLEDDPVTNAGTGSNLTRLAQVENDAAIMDGKTLLYGGCGSVKKVKNPIELAHDICIKQLVKHPLGLIQPSLLVGHGALLYATNLGLKIVRNKDLVTPKTLRHYNKYKGFTEVEISINKEALDTVGAVCVDKYGDVASGCSSGGLLLKRPGRVGQGALYASGVWADSFAKDIDSSIAICTTGCGEDLVKTQLAKEIANDMKNCTCPTTVLSKSMTEKFLDSRFLHNAGDKNCGALVVYVTNTGEGTVLWGHSTHNMGVGYMKLSDPNPKTIISIMPNDVKVGTRITVGGTHFYIDKNT